MDVSFLRGAVGHLGLSARNGAKEVAVATESSRSAKTFLPFAQVAGAAYGRSMSAE